MKFKKFKKAFNLGYIQCIGDILNNVERLQKDYPTSDEENIYSIKDIKEYANKALESLDWEMIAQRIYMKKYGDKNKEKVVDKNEDIKTDLSVIPNYLFCYKANSISVFEEGKLYKIKTRQDGVQYIQVDNDEYEYYLANIQSALFAYVHIDNINEFEEEYYNHYICIKKDKKSEGNFTVGKCYAYNNSLHVLETDKKPEKLFMMYFDSFCKKQKIELMGVRGWQV